MEPPSKQSGRLDAVTRRINELLELDSNWDSYGAARVNPIVAEQAVFLISALLDTGVPEPTIVPTVKGGLQLEWHTGGVDLEIELNYAI